MRNRVLITSVGRKVSLVRAFKEAGWQVSGLDLDSTSIALKSCESFIIPVDLVVPTRDAEIENFVGNPEIASKETLSICLDKLKFYHWCNKHGFITPEVYFTKPRISQSGDTKEYVWQEPLEGEEYSVDCFLDFESRPISIVPRRRVKVLNGESSVTTTVRNDSILQQALSLATSLSLVGHNVLQCFYKDSVCIWTDVNPRFGGASIVSIRAGCKSPEWLLKLVNQEEVKPCLGEYKVGLTGYSYTEWRFENEL